MTHADRLRGGESRVTGTPAAAPPPTQPRPSPDDLRDKMRTLAAELVGIYGRAATAPDDTALAEAAELALPAHGHFAAAYHGWLVVRPGAADRAYQQIARGIERDFPGVAVEVTPYGYRAVSQESGEDLARGSEQAIRALLPYRAKPGADVPYIA